MRPSFSVGEHLPRSQGACRPMPRSPSAPFALEAYMKEANSQCLQYRRIVVVDIETVSLDPNLDKGALDALTGRIVCIGMLMDDGTCLKEVAIAGEDEVQILTKFWSTIKSTDVLVGHNVLEFDIPFIRQRSWIMGIRPSRVVDLRKYYTVDVQDTMQVWTNWGFKKGVT